MSPLEIKGSDGQQCRVFPAKFNGLTIRIVRASTENTEYREGGRPTDPRLTRYHGARRPGLPREGICSGGKLKEDDRRKIPSVAFSAGAQILLVAVLERWLAAFWMVYEFMGYETPAFITLGRQTASLVILAALTGGGISLVMIEVAGSHIKRRME